MTKKENPEMPEINRKLVNNKNYPLIVNGYHYKKIAKEQLIWYLSTILASRTTKLLLSFSARFTLITLVKDV